MLRYLPILAVIALVVYTVVDVVNSEDDDRLGVHPALWILGIVLFPPLGSIAWLAVRFARKNRTAPRPSAGPAGPAAPASRPGPLAPDDDPEFLWRLEQEAAVRSRSASAARPTTTPRAPDRPAPDHRAPDHEAVVRALVAAGATGDYVA